jgi:hypothetical protein
MNSRFPKRSICRVRMKVTGSSSQSFLDHSRILVSEITIRNWRKATPEHGVEVTKRILSETLRQPQENEV